MADTPQDSAHDPADHRPPPDLTRLAATVDRLRTEIARLHATADTRALLELAKGVLIERLHCGPAEATRQLALLSERAGITPLELAADLIGHTARDRLSDTDIDAAEAAGDTAAVHAAAAAVGDAATVDVAAADAAEVAVDEVAAGAVAEVDSAPVEARVSSEGVAAVDGGTAAVVDGPGADSSRRVASVVRLRAAESGVLAAGNGRRVAESVLSHAAGPLGATAVVIWSAGFDGSLSLCGYAGVGRAEAVRWRYLPPGVAASAGKVLSQRDSMFVADVGGAGLLPIAGRSGSRFVAPIRVGGKLLGVLEVCWGRAIALPELRVRRQLEALAELCAHTLDAELTAPQRDEVELGGLVRLAEDLFDPVLVLLPILDGDGGVADFRIHHANKSFADPAGRSRQLIVGSSLLEMYPMSAGPGRLFERMEEVFATGASYRADAAGLTELIGRSQLPVPAALSMSRHGDAVLLVCRVQDESTRSAELLRQAQHLGGVGGFEENAATGEITWSNQLFGVFGLAANADPIPLALLPMHVHETDAQAAQRFLRTILRYRRPATAALRLLRPDGAIRHVRVVAEPVLDPAGNLLAIRGAYQDASAQHWTEMALSATRDRLSHTEEHAAEQSRLARRLQEAIMPPAQPAIEARELRVAARYRPAEQDHLVGGDWYDVLVLPSRQVFVSVGDIAGHGISAATGMVLLRNALRGLAVTGAGPGRMLAWLNLVARHPADTIFATAVCGLYDPETRILRWARAGHLPPVLVRAGAASALPALGGMILGAMTETPYVEGDIQLEPGDVLLLYTDGLIERRDRRLDDCVRRLLTESAKFTGTLDDRLDSLLDSGGADTDDDMCVVGIQVGGDTE
ncbi:SpoIIE family protein phosphatase [Nocardia yamanashiensis]|uniref:SpoIIE family protein phosphatase n=1 Tax=Nocardia yamanashiensis TaxID=209247 RepID=UPI000A066D4E|nr:SpoIIE family protein phosphatase [Nocardia yamanashiensis]